MPAAYQTFRRTTEDEANLAAIAAALSQTAGRPLFLTASDAIRAALRVAAEYAARGDLGRPSGATGRVWRGLPGRMPRAAPRTALQGGLGSPEQTPPD